LRSVQLARRKTASDDSSEAAAAIRRRKNEVMDAFSLKDGDTVAGYWPIRDELDPRPLMAALAENGLMTALPTTPMAGKPLIFRHWQEGKPLIAGLYGTSEPPPEAPICTPKLLLIPMLAFDDKGFRLGYGGGFYDRSLASLRQNGAEIHALGLAYDSQRVAAIPTGPHDARLDGVLTVTGLYLMPKDD
jgi:5-formyltetrahydrofolate cyclo-ligase